MQVNPPVTVGTVVDFLKNNEALKAQRDKTITVKTTVGEIMDLFGEENVKEFVQQKTAEADGRVHVCGHVSGEISGSIDGVIDAIIDGNVNLKLLSGNIIEEKEVDSCEE